MVGLLKRFWRGEIPPDRKHLCPSHTGFRVKGFRVWGLGLRGLGFKVYRV